MAASFNPLDDTAPVQPDPAIESPDEVVNQVKQSKATRKRNTAPQLSAGHCVLPFGVVDALLGAYMKTRSGEFLTKEQATTQARLAAARVAERIGSAIEREIASLLQELDGSNGLFDPDTDSDDNPDDDDPNKNDIMIG